jgi:DUF4097 and DUF4098 domain-containing protein YvlB
MQDPRPVALSACLGLAALLAAFDQPARSQSAGVISRESGYWVQTVSGTIPATRTIRLRILTDGNVTADGGAVDIIRYTLKRRVKARSEREAERLLRELDVRPRVQGEWVYLTTAVPQGDDFSAELAVTASRLLRQVWLETRGGNVRVTGFDGVVEASTRGGRIDLDRLGSDATARTGGGEVHVGRVAGGLRCTSGGGAIRVESVGRESWFETAGGDIRVREALGPVHAATAGGDIHVERSAAEVFARTAGGVIDVQQAGGVVTAETSGGAIQVDAAKGVRCESRAGMIRLRNAAGPMSAATAAGSIVALLSGKRLEDSVLSTSSGDVTVFIASNIPVTVQARNETAGPGARIVSDFPEIRVRSSQQAGAPPPVMADGALNGGGPVLRIFASGGTIYLRRQK